MSMNSAPGNNNPENLSREEVVKRLKENPEDISPLVEYLTRLQEQRGDLPETEMEISRIRAEIYEQAGLLVDAFREYFATYFCAKNLRHEELAQNCISKYQEMKEKINAEMDRLEQSGDLDAAEALCNKFNEAEDYCDWVERGT